MSAEHEPFILRGRILVDTELREGAVVVEQGHIAAVLDAPAAQASELPDPLAGAPADRIIASGFIDLQLNGAFGADCSEGPEALAHIARELPRTGVTTFLPTLVSTEREAYPAMLAALPCALGPGPSAQSGPLRCRSGRFRPEPARAGCRAGRAGRAGRARSAGACAR